MTRQWTNLSDLTPEEKKERRRKQNCGYSADHYNNKIVTSPEKYRAKLDNNAKNAKIRKDPVLHAIVSVQRNSNAALAGNSKEMNSAGVVATEAILEYANENSSEIGNRKRSRTAISVPTKRSRNDDDDNSQPRFTVGQRIRQPPPLYRRPSLRRSLKVDFHTLPHGVQLVIERYPDRAPTVEDSCDIYRLIIEASINIETMVDGLFLLMNPFDNDASVAFINMSLYDKIIDIRGHLTCGQVKFQVNFPMSLYYALDEMRFHSDNKKTFEYGDNIVATDPQFYRRYNEAITGLYGIFCDIFSRHQQYFYR